MADGDPNPGGQATVNSIQETTVILSVDSGILEYLKVGPYSVTFKPAHHVGHVGGDGEKE